MKTGRGWIFSFNLQGGPIPLNTTGQVSLLQSGGHLYYGQQSLSYTARLQDYGSNLTCIVTYFINFTNRDESSCFDHPTKDCSDFIQPRWDVHLSPGAGEASRVQKGRLRIARAV